MAYEKTTGDASRKSQAEGERWRSDPHTVERADRQADGEAGGVTNRPLDEERASQNEVPDRGEAREGAHAGRGDSETGEGRSER
jgi:hypothetical protein